MTPEAFYSRMQRSIVKPKTIPFLLIFLVLVLSYFWLGSRYPELNNKAKMAGTLPITDLVNYDAYLSVNYNDLYMERVYKSFINWINTNKKGMLFGWIFAAIAMSLIQCFRQTNPKGRFKKMLLGIVTGAPLGVCVNCAAPIARGLKKNGVSSLVSVVIMHSSPTLNIVVLTMAFTLFPLPLAFAKVGLTIFFLFFLTLSLGGGEEKSEVATSNEPISLKGWGASFMEALLLVGKNFTKVVALTLHWMLLAGLIGAFIASTISFTSIEYQGWSFLMALVLSLFGLLLPVPMAFDMILCQFLWQAGMPLYYVAILFFVLGIHSIFSFFMTSRMVGLKKGLIHAFVILVMGNLFGYATYVIAGDIKNDEQFLDEYVNDENVEYDFEAAEETRPRYKSAPEKFYHDKNLMILSRNHQKRNIAAKKFTLHLADEIGIKDFSLEQEEMVRNPYGARTPITSGDINNDSMDDVIVAKADKVEIFLNYGGSFRKVEKVITFPKDTHIQSVIVGDFNNDRYNDLYVATTITGNFIVYNDGKLFSSDNVSVEKIETPSYFTTAAALGDFNQDGLLDIYEGNTYFDGFYFNPPQMAQDYLVFNRGKGRFDFAPAESKVAGQTLSTLVADLNGDSLPDIAALNDYDVSDYFYYNQGKGVFKKLASRDDLIPEVTHTSMGIDSADFNNDLIPDLYLVQISGKFSTNFETLRHIDNCKIVPLEKYQDQCRFAKKFKRAVASSNCDIFEKSHKKDYCLALVELNSSLRNKTEMDCSKVPERAPFIRNLCTTYMKHLGETSLLDQYLADQNVKNIVNKKQYLDKDSPYRELLLGNALRSEHLRKNLSDEIPQSFRENILLKGLGEGEFERVTDSASAIGAWGWTGNFADLDNDEYQDIFLVNSAWADDQINPNYFYHNQKGQGFKSAAEEFGLKTFVDARSYVYIDYDLDGDLDILLESGLGPLFLLRNAESENNSIDFSLYNFKGSTTSIGAKVYIYYDGKAQYREIKASGGFKSYGPYKLSFGLGESCEVDKVVIHWPDQTVDTIERPFLCAKSYIVERN